MRRNRLEHLTDKTAGRPVCHSNHPAGTANSLQLGRDQFRTRSKHRPKHRDHGVETRVVIRQRFRVAFVELRI
jgi:hypothetical protein